MNAKGIFVTATDTGVGKTVVTAALVSLFRTHGIEAVAMKPIQTGCVITENGLEATDLTFCLKANEIRVPPEQKQLLAPYRFEKVCSPHFAAHQSGVDISISRIVDAFFDLAESHDLVIVEGAGGLLVPIGRKSFILDVMSALELPVVVVARPGLGTINHTLLTLRELEEARLPVLGVMMNATDPIEDDEIVCDNQLMIERLGNTAILGMLPFQENVGTMSSKDFRAWCLPCITSAERLLERFKTS